LFFELPPAFAGGSDDQISNRL